MSNSSRFGIKDLKNNIIMLWTPRAGCTVSCHTMFNHMGLIGEKTSQTEIHKYRGQFYKTHGHVTPEDLEKCFVFKMIVNPYQRAVSCYAVYALSFKDHSFYHFLEKISQKNTNHLLPNILHHIIPQYVKNEENYINAYIKLENGQNEINQKINQPLGLNLLLLTDGLIPAHKTIREKTDKLFGYVPRNQIAKFPESYRQFYDDAKIKKLVEIIYGDDITNYGYSFDDPF